MDRTRSMTAEQAQVFATLALGHVGREFPYKLDQVLMGPGDLATPRALHPIFYGSFDWHSCVHSHWLLARLLRRFPDIAAADEIRAWLAGAFTSDKVAGEVAYLARPGAAGFERPYGWAWLLKLQSELEAHDGPWAETLRPLARAFEARLLAWLPKATYPTRTGMHGNSAFALTLAHAYAPFAADPGFAEALKATALRWYGDDTVAHPLEPSGADFLSPTLIEAECMRLTLPEHLFPVWLSIFLPRLEEGQPAVLFTPAEVSDRTDGQIAHLDGLNLSRAWCFRHLGQAAPALANGLLAAADLHLDAALPHLGDHYMGEHWLASFALLALDD